MKPAIQIKSNHSYKIGVSEIVGLEQVMRDTLKPIQDLIKSKIYWSDVDMDLSEYKSRDGFIAHSHNFGGIEISEIIPKCEEYEFSFLDFGDWDGTHYCDETDTENCECHAESDGEYDAKLRVWLKFEGLENDTLKFYLVCSGGNNDAPYFREKYSSTYFEAEFACKRVSDVQRASSKHIAKLLKLIKGA